MTMGFYRASVIADKQDGQHITPVTHEKSVRDEGGQAAAAQ
jgi:hypothetical protein